MPFTKGMLHCVDFHEFICNQLGVDSCDGIKIKDAFGGERNLGDVQIVLTQSMFKVFSWLQNSSISGVRKNDSSSAKDNDKLVFMKLFFERFHKYDHGFYVCNTDINFQRSNRVALNYQFLNTLALTKDEMESLVRENFDDACLSDNGKLFKEAFAQTMEDEVEKAEGSFDALRPPSKTFGRGTTWLEVTLRKSAFLEDPKVKGMLEGIRKERRKKAGYGRLFVKGCLKYLSSDLLRLLTWMLQNIDEKSLSKEEKEKLVEDLKKRQLFSSRFFTADCIPNNPALTGCYKQFPLDASQYYGLLRSPHLSRNEQCSLRPYFQKKNKGEKTDSLYQKYFGHLRGVLMVAPESLVPLMLGGADFDGDLVKLVADSRINRAINDACYKDNSLKKNRQGDAWPDGGDVSSIAGSAKEKDEKTDILPNSTAMDGQEQKGNGRKHERMLPVVIIPNLTVQDRVLNKENKYQAILNTFSNQIGKVSNLAITLGRCEYGEEYDSKFDLLCESCTILTGLEIDAAKTGKHPDLKALFEARGMALGGNPYLQAMFEEEKKDYFVKRKEEITGLPNHTTFGFRNEKEEKEKKLPNRYIVYEKGRKDYELLKVVNPKEYPGFGKIDNLPYALYLEMSGEKGVKDEQKNKKSAGKEKVSDGNEADAMQIVVSSYEDATAVIANVALDDENMAAAMANGVRDSENVAAANDTGTNENVVTATMDGTKMDKTANTAKKLKRFAFEENKNWKKSLTNTGKKNVVTELRIAYTDILSLADKVSRLEEERNKCNYTGYIHTILKLQYMGVKNEEELICLQENVTNRLSESVKSFENVSKMLDQLVSEEQKHRWPFLRTVEEKDRYLLETLGLENLDADIRGILQNFWCNGYNLLFFFLKNIYARYLEANPDVEVEMVEREEDKKREEEKKKKEEKEAEKKKEADKEKEEEKEKQGEKTGGEVEKKEVVQQTSAKEPNKYYMEFREIYLQALKEKKPKRVWKRQILLRCRQELREVFEKGTEGVGSYVLGAEAVKYVHAQRGKNQDPNGTFFWDVFSAEEILKA